MNKYIHFILFFLFISCVYAYAQNNEVVVKSNTVPVVNGYYQTIDLNPETPCGCETKTQRTHELNKALKTRDVLDYNLHTYKFTFGSSRIPVAKLFRALENDASVYKVSMKEWDSFMLLTTKDFNASSFETAALKVFDTFLPANTEDFLKLKSTASYIEYLQNLVKEKDVTEESNPR